MEWLTDWFSGFGDWLQTGTGVALFITVAAIGVIMLLLALIFDSIFDFDDGPFSMTGMGAFLASFGFSGWIAINSGMKAGASAIIGGIVGVLCWVAAYFIVKLLRGGEPESLSVQDYVGLNGRLSTAIRDAGVGEMILNIRGESVHLAAYSDTPISAGKLVEITSIRGTGSVFVQEVRQQQGEAPIEEVKE